MIKNVQVTERDYLLGKMRQQGCLKVNVCFIRNFSNHFHTHADEKRYKYTDVFNVDNYINNKPTDTVAALSTTFLTKENYISTIGFDVELIPSSNNFTFLAEFLTQNMLTGSVFRTANGYHLFLDEYFDNDRDLIRREFELIWLAAKKHGDCWVEQYYKRIVQTSSYNKVKKLAKEILKNVGHVESGMYTVFDMRHIAYGYTVNERRRDKKADGKLRTQHFFRIEKRNDSDFEPFLVFTTEKLENSN